MENEIEWNYKNAKCKLVKTSDGWISFVNGRPSAHAYPTLLRAKNNIKRYCDGPQKPKKRIERVGN